MPKKKIPRNLGDDDHHGALPPSMPDRDDATVLPGPSRASSSLSDRKPRAEDKDEIKKIDKPPSRIVDQVVSSPTAQAAARSYAYSTADERDGSAEKERQIKEKAAGGKATPQIAPGVPLKTPNPPHHDSDEELKARRAVEASAAQGRPGAVLIRGISSTLSVDGSDETRQVDNAEYDVDSYSTGFGNATVEPAGSNHNLVAAYKVKDETDGGYVPAAEVVNTKRQRNIRFCVLVAVAIVVAAIAVPVAIVVSKGNESGKTPLGVEEIEFTTITSGLCSPRHLAVHDDMLYVPESGVGPIPIPGDSLNSELCLQSTLFPDMYICYGETGRVTTFSLDGESTGEPQLDGLFSARSVQGSGTDQVYGPTAVDFDGDGNMLTLIGLGYVNATDLSNRNPELVFGSVVRDDALLASPWVPIFENVYSGAPFPESNPFHMTVQGRAAYIADAGADLLVTYLDVANGGTGEPDSVVVIPRIDDIPAVQPNPRGGPCNDVTPPMGPPFCGEYQDEQGNWLYSTSPVPVAVRINPEEPDKIYVACLSGAIWNAPVSGFVVMDLVEGIPQEDTMRFITNEFWAIIDFDFYDGDMLVLESSPGGFVPFGGRLSRVRIDPDTLTVASKVIITEHLQGPIGIVVYDDCIYLTNNTYNSGINGCDGEILKARLTK